MSKGIYNEVETLSVASLPPLEEITVVFSTAATLYSTYGVKVEKLPHLLFKTDDVILLAIRGDFELVSITDYLNSLPPLKNVLDTLQTKKVFIRETCFLYDKIDLGQALEAIQIVMDPIEVCFIP